LAGLNDFAGKIVSIHHRHPAFPEELG
jgi:hypothetical protein